MTLEVVAPEGEIVHIDLIDAAHVRVGRSTEASGAGSCGIQRWWVASGRTLSARKPTSQLPRHDLLERIAASKCWLSS